MFCNTAGYQLWSTSILNVYRASTDCRVCWVCHICDRCDGTTTALYGPLSTRRWSTIFLWTDTSGRGRTSSRSRIWQCSNSDIATYTDRWHLSWEHAVLTKCCFFFFQRLEVFQQHSYLQQWTFANRLPYSQGHLYEKVVECVKCIYDQVGLMLYYCMVLYF